jgi:methyl-accepting chemotaxis protein
MIRLGVRGKLLASFAAVFVLIAALACFLFLQTASTNNSIAKIGGQTLPETVNIGGLHLAVAEYHRDQLNYLAAPSAKERTDALAEMQKHASEVSDAFTAFASADLAGAERMQYDAAKAAWTTYQSETADLVALVDAGKMDGATALLFGDAATTMDSFDTALDAWTQAMTDGANQDVNRSQNTVALLELVLVGGVLAIVLVGSVLALFISGRITAGVKAVQGHMIKMREQVGSLADCLTRLSENDLTASYEGHVEFLELKGTDEIAQTVVISNELLAEFETMAGAYETARGNLAEALSEVREAAASVAHTSSQLTEAANQSGSASTQITQTINQVAAGAQDQAQAASSTSASVVELTSAIDEVGVGAGQTTAKIGASAAAVKKLASAIDAAGKASTEVDAVSAEAAVAAAQGLGAVQETVTGMGRIKDAVDASAAKVTELGAKSGQIGAIVETIDDIA